MIRYVLTVLFLIYVFVDSNIVVTRNGPIMGYKSADGIYTTYYGVPYAKVDERNPFGNSFDYPNFTEPFNANDSTIRCPQAYFNPGGVLQCLILNIYVPQTANSMPLPILVWFHGGGFGFGTSGEYGGQYLIQHDIIVVTVNYRLGPYGFLCLDDPKVPGNQGLKDQIAALKWIRRNINAFGGDASKVTIAGESYGGGAVDLHLYSDYDTYFDRAIIESGSILAQGFFKQPDYGAAIKLASYLGHNVNTMRDALESLAYEAPVKVMDAAKNLSMMLTVCKEKFFKGVDHFVTRDPFHLKHKRVKNMPVLIGYNSKEDFGSFFNKTAEFYKDLGNIFYTKLNDNFVLPKSEMDDVSDVMKRFYLGGKSIGPESSLELVDFSSDFLVNYPTEWSVNNYLENGAKVFKYVFSYIGGSQYVNVTGVGAYHTEELGYLFHWTFAKPLVTEEQRLLRDRMTRMWANFVTFGNPTPAVTELLPTIWQSIPLNSSARPYLNIDFTMTMMDNVYKERMAFWQLFWHTHEKCAKINDQRRNCY